MTRRPRVLVIDDDPTALQVTTAQLTPEGYEIVCEGGGAAGLLHLDGEPFDLVICDVMMPELDGYAVARAVKKHPEWRYVPIILLTALGAREAIVTGLEAGADEFVTKPVEGEVLRARARSMLRVRNAYTGLRRFGSEPPPADRRAELVDQARLTGREREVLELLLLGRTHEDIAAMLGISERTSKFHQANLLAKLGAESRLDLMRLFL
ncbi:MAG: response regulator [Deltaproteobacteria bacterium]|nr:response regulator [Deltaproteobacteria bacterium]MCW5808771.1 response regulator [Deltaproteobacteria bacterium]